MDPTDENFENVKEESRKTLIHLLSLAMKKEISWPILASLINEMASTHVKSKEIIKILLNEFENLDANSSNDSAEDDILNSENQTIIEEIPRQIEEEVKGLELENEAFDIGASQDQEKDAYQTQIYEQECKLCHESFETAEGYANHINVHENIDRMIDTSFDQINVKGSDIQSNVSPLKIGSKTFEEMPKSRDSKEMKSTTELKGQFDIHKTSKPTTGKNQLKCKTCGKCFKTKWSKNIHERTHTGEKPYSCKSCNKCFSHSSNLKEHERIHTGEKPFQCNKCSKSFRLAGDFRAHERIHTGEKPFQCKICEKKFSSSSSFRKHARNHKGERPYKCKICKKDYTQSSDLKIHERIHTGEKPYHCKSCSKSFTRNSTLKVHEKSHIANM